MKFLFIQLGRIGDMVLLTPVFSAVKMSYQEAEIDVIASRRNFTVIKNNPNLNKIIIYEKTPFKLIRTIREIRQKEYDYLIDPKDHYSRESHLLARLSKSKKKIGFNIAGKLLYDISIPSDFDNRDIHCTQRFFNSLKSLSMNVNPENPRPELFTNAGSDEFVKDFLNKKNLNNFILINISATLSNRMFTTQKWVDILRSCNLENMVIVAAPTELNSAMQLIKSLPKLILFPSRSINDVISIVKLATKLITVDTALVHIASAFNTPIFSFFIGNDEQIKKYYPLSDKAFIMKSENPGLGIETINTDEIKIKLIDFINMNPQN